ncbi:non-canonical purine NTP pyrophosphatase, RdgB/HAM1 family [Abiotrophia defectiva ATCC 49176]|uniref:dITP/XTP pyrophosphatase n=1 Tax=Abiotrophia defectiva ATCC 49176 TaxID=592010 RepID=W1Q5P9_ABIDE|nr:non-canonical purine NTP pyrophosphatase, RdgB/HAM1 family [Abiotrophia defectiva ATCC 49176]
MRFLKLVIATQNKGKVAEFERLLGPKGIEVVSLLDYPDLPEVEETGDSFEANARLKAESIAKLLNLPVLADDSGLVVPYLNGAPGIYSARYAGQPKSDKANIDKLLREMSQARGDQRQAYFVTCLVLASPDHDSYVVEGRAYGTIALEPSGDSGFGYDPVFYVDQEGATFAQIPLSRKNQISHRANAIKALLASLPEWLEVTA